MRSTAARRKANTVVRPGGNGYCHPAMNSDMHTDAGWLHRFGPVDQLVSEGLRCPRRRPGPVEALEAYGMTEAEAAKVRVGSWPGVFQEVHR